MEAWEFIRDGVNWLLGALSALATVAVGWFAWVQMERESHREERATKTADAQASAIAYRLRRQLLSWLGPPEDDQPPLREWLSRVRVDGKYAEHIDRAEQLVVELSGMTRDTSEGVAGAIQEAYVSFLSATRRLNEHVAQPSAPGGGEAFDWMKLIGDAGKELIACVDSLERHVIDRKLLETEAELDRLRAAEDPFLLLTPDEGDG